MTFKEECEKITKKKECNLMKEGDRGGKYCKWINLAGGKNSGKYGCSCKNDDTYQSVCTS